MRNKSGGQTMSAVSRINSHSQKLPVLAFPTRLNPVTNVLHELNNRAGLSTSIFRRCVSSGA